MPTAKLTPVATRTTELTALVPCPQGRTHCPDASSARHEDPGPLTGSYPAIVASDWNRVIEKPVRMVKHLRAYPSESRTQRPNALYHRSLDMRYTETVQMSVHCHHCSTLRHLVSGHAARQTSSQLTVVTPQFLRNDCQSRIANNIRVTHPPGHNGFLPQGCLQM